jgi:choice-of-anchor B domain-containing protein
LTPDHRFFIVDDELDELDFGHNTRTYTWDVSDLDNPVLEGFFEASGPSIDHNQYVHNGHTFQANYRRGLRILRVVDPTSASLEEAFFFDTYPANDEPSFSGAWSTYPFFASGTVLVSDINRGLFVLRPAFSIFQDGFETGDLSAWSDAVP